MSHPLGSILWRYFFYTWISIIVKILRKWKNNITLILLYKLYYFFPFWRTVFFILLLCSYIHITTTYLSITCKKQYVINRNLEKISLCPHQNRIIRRPQKLSMRNVIKCHMLMVLCWCRCCVAQNNIEKKSFYIPLNLILIVTKVYVCTKWRQSLNFKCSVLFFSAVA